MKKIVPPIRKSSYDTGAASEFLVLSMLYRLGANAFISLGNKKSIDIIINSKKGISITVDVKSVRGYSSIVVNNVKKSPNHFIVAVVYKDKFTNPLILPDFYIIPSSKINNLAYRWNTQRRLMIGQIGKYKNTWEQILV